nr:ABC transporter ATP-binding protein [Aquiflexum lacus]
MQEKKADTFAQQMVNVLKYPIDNFRKIQNLGKFQDNEEGVHWALKDVSFEVKQGEVLGIIGKNGAGKSTLLKILSKITEPTSGRIEMNGRVAALLEVGTGFHPELTGRENIYMNGTILGMTKKEIDRKLEEIIDFSGVEKYVDTPVKFYSSGMRVRLGFSVAAHLEPEILIIDEVLAVGDFEFQKKCLGKIEDVSKNQGRTVLFVSHQLGTINQLCNSAIWMNNGQIEQLGKTRKIIKEYISSISDIKSEQFEATGIELEKQYHIKKFALINTEGKASLNFGTNEHIKIKVDFGFSNRKNNIEIAIALFDYNENRIFTIHEPLFRNNTLLDKKQGSIVFELPPNYLTPGSYHFVATIHIPHLESFHLIEKVCVFSIVETGSNFSDYEGINIGVVFPQYRIIDDYV